MAKDSPNYGLDAPGLVGGFFLGGPLLVVLGILLAAWAKRHSVPVLNTLSGMTAGTGIILFVEAILMVASSYFGKFRARDRLLRSLCLRGCETILDVGCGHGLLLIGAAKLLPRGSAVGIDIWSGKDQSSNSREATLRNAMQEGVAERVEVHDGDMRRMPFPDASFDAVIANLAIHNISSRQGRREAIQEFVRTLKPGGQVALMDFQKVGEYATDLRAAGMEDVHVSGFNFWIFPPVRTARGRKKGLGSGWKR